MTFTSGDPEAAYPSTSVRNQEQGIVPPYLDKDWQAMRAYLRIASAHATAAAQASTIEDVRQNGSAAQIALMDADFIRRRIERKEQPVD